jgi:hypothetical protein
MCRDGELLFVDRRRRLLIAKILELNKIPVFPLVRHRQWCMNLNLSEENKI